MPAVSGMPTSPSPSNARLRLHRAAFVMRAAPAPCIWELALRSALRPTLTVERAPPYPRRVVHAVCPGVYGYAYDDGMGLAQCPAGTKYHVTFYCPE